MPPKRKRKLSLGGNSGQVEKGHSKHKESVQIVTPVSLKVTRSQTPVSEDDQYAIFSIDNLQLCFNEVYKDHRIQFPNCWGDLNMKKKFQQIISTSWNFTCSKCSFSSKSYRMFKTNERTDGKKGRKMSTLNQALGVALVRSSIGATVFAEILLNLGIKPGAHSSISKLVDDGSAICEQVCQDHLKQTRANLKGKQISVEADSRYNNAIGSRETPFQAGTQSVFTVCENITDRKQIIDFVVQNKLCTGCSRLHNQGVDVVPGGHPNCTATMKISDSIGAEGISAEQCAKKLKKEGLNISHITTDGDSQSGKKFQLQYPNAEALQCLVHFSKRQKNSIIKEKSFSEHMFQGETKKQKEIAQKWFAEDIRQRCSAEIKLAVKKCSDMGFKSDVEVKKKLKSLLSKTPDAIIRCHKGDCGDMCAKYSFACRGRKGDYQWKKDRMFKKKTIKPTKADEDILKSHILNRLGSRSLNVTYLNSNTNKCEGSHRGYTKTNPKSITCPKNFKGRNTAAILCMNLGFNESTHRLHSATGHKVSEDIKREILKRSKTYDNKKRIQKQTGAQKKHEKIVHV